MSHKKATSHVSLGPKSTRDNDLAADKMSLAASDLIHDDSRRLVVDETELLEEELDTEREVRRKGKLRAFDEDEPEDEEEGPQDKTLLHPPRPAPSRHESYEYSSTDTHQVKREKRRKYWQNAAINVLFIASWYFFSSLISVYSTSRCAAFVGRSLMRVSQINGCSRLSTTTLAIRSL